MLTETICRKRPHSMLRLSGARRFEPSNLSPLPSPVRLPRRCVTRTCTRNAQVNAKAELDERKWEEPEPPPGTASALATAPPAKTAAGAAPRLPPVAPAHCIRRDCARPFADPEFVTGGGLPLSGSRSRITGRCAVCLAGRPAKGSGGALAVAIAADGVACSAPGYAPLRASIGGVDHEGATSWSRVENVSEGRPVMRGVWCPILLPGGALVVRARGARPTARRSTAGPAIAVSRCLS